MPVMELEGRIVEFMESGGLRFGFVRRREQRKLQVVDRRGRHSSVPASRVIVVHQALEEAHSAAAIEDILAAVERREREIDIPLLWESVHTEHREFNAAELAAIYFGESSPVAESAMFRALDSDPLFFKRSGTLFRPRATDQVASEKTRLEREQERNAFRERITELLRQATRNGPPTGDSQWPEIAERLEKWFRHGDRDDVGSILERVVGPTRAREAAYELLAKCGRVASSEDRFLLLRGIAATFPAEALERSLKLAPVISEAGRACRIGPPTVAIDDEDTLEIDDALTLTEDGAGAVVEIHIADVSAFVTKDDALDREAHQRSATIYLPNITVTMFPPRLATDLASLVDGCPRPAFTVEARFDSSDALVDFRIHRTLIQVTEKIAYEAADRALEAGSPFLVRLSRIAERLHAARAARGAQIHRRPEIKVRVRDDAIHLNRIEVSSPARLIVTEMMILANRLAADRAAASGIPIIFRTQEPPGAEPPEIHGLPEALQFELLRKSFKRSRLSLTPRPHAGLGLTAYTQISSPIRRYADLITQRQFVAALAGEPLPYDRDELLRIITTAETAELDLRRLEQTSTSYWVMTYLAKERMDAWLPAVLLDHRGTAELTDYLVRGKISNLNDSQPGATVEVQIESVDPLRSEIRLRART